MLAPRAGLKEREAPGKVVTARPSKRLAQMRSVSHALVSTLQKHRSKTSKLIQFGSRTRGRGASRSFNLALGANINQAPSHGGISGAMTPQIFCAPRILLRPEKLNI